MEETKIAFAKQVKEEIAKQVYSKEEMKYILSGFIRNNGTFGLKLSLTLHTEISSVAKLMYTALTEVYDLKPVISYERVARFNRNLVYLVTVEDRKLYEVMEDLEIFADGGFSRMQPKIGLHLKNFRYLVIGSFLANGSVNNPNSPRSSYFLEMAFTDKRDAMAVLRKLQSFREEKTMDFKYIKRREKHVLYLKKSSQIPVFLSYVNALSAMMDYENARIEKEEMNIANRLAICDSANYTKTLDRARKDIGMINTLLSFRPIGLFDEKTQAVIKARLAHKDDNYRELADHILQDSGISITKSGVVHVLSNLRAALEEIEKDRPASK